MGKRCGKKVENEEPKDGKKRDKGWEKGNGKMRWKKRGWEKGVGKKGWKKGWKRGLKGV